MVSAGPPVEQVTTGLLDLLALCGHTIYDGVYAGDPVTPTFPHGILYGIAGGAADPFPDLDAAYGSATLSWQLSAISAVRVQAEWLARTCRDLLLARGPSGWANPLLPIDGWACCDRRPDTVPAGVLRTGEHPRSIFTAPLRFTLTYTPA